MDIVAGSDYLYVYHADGSAPVDADGSGATLGDSPRRAVLLRGGLASPRWIRPTAGRSSARRDTAGVYVFDRNGNVRPAGR